MRVGHCHTGCALLEGEARQRLQREKKGQRKNIELAVCAEKLRLIDEYVAATSALFHIVDTLCLKTGADFWEASLVRGGARGMLQEEDRSSESQGPAPMWFLICQIRFCWLHRFAASKREHFERSQNNQNAN